MFQSEERVTKTIYKDFDLGFFSSSNFYGLEQVVQSHRTSCRRGWPRGFGQYILVLTPENLLPSNHFDM